MAPVVLLKRPGTPMPTVSTAPASRPASISRSITASGPASARVFFWPRAATSAVLQDDPLDVRSSQVEPEVAAHLAVQPPSTTSTVPVTNGAVAR